MSSLDTLNVGGIDFDIEDSTSRVNSTSALNITAYKEDSDTASQAYAVIGTPINWKGTLYYTSATIASGDTLAVGTNLVSAVNIGQMLTNIKTYVGSDSKLHFTDATGADSVLPFSGSRTIELLGSSNFTSSGASVTLNIALSKVPESYIVAFSSVTGKSSGDSAVESRSVSIASKTLNNQTLTVVLSSQAWAYHAVYVSGTCAVYGF